MTLEHALRLTEILLGLAFLQQSAEHLHASAIERRLFVCRAILSLLLATGVMSQWVCAALLINGLFILKYFQGPYNGGSDRMGLLILCCLCAALFMPDLRWREYAFGYLAMQVVLSYFISGWVKIANPEWRSGRALQDVMLFSAYPVSEDLRGWAYSPRLLYYMSWMVMLFELLFSFTLFMQVTLIMGLLMATLFHFANASLLGLNRFFWVWLAAFPSLIWLQHRIFSG